MLRHRRAHQPLIIPRSGPQPRHPARRVADLPRDEDRYEPTFRRSCRQPTWSHALTKRDHSAFVGRTQPSPTASELTTKPGATGASSRASWAMYPAGLSSKLRTPACESTPRRSRCLRSRPVRERVARRRSVRRASRSDPPRPRSATRATAQEALERSPSCRRFARPPTSFDARRCGLSGGSEAPTYPASSLVPPYAQQIS